MSRNNDKFQIFVPENSNNILNISSRNQNKKMIIQLSSLMH